MRSSTKNRKLQSFFINQPHNDLLRINQVSSFLSQLSLFTRKHQTLITSSNTPQNNTTHKDSSSINFSGIAKSVISRCPHLWDNKGETFTNVALQDYLLTLSRVCPCTIRRFWRVNVLKPQDVLEILVGFEFNSVKNEVELQKVESLWGIFKWASEQSNNFEHVPRSCKIMAKMLVQVGMFNEAEWLLSRLDTERISLDYNGIFSDLIQGYVGRFQLKRAILNYDRMRLLGLVPSLSCYRALVKYLVQMNEGQLAYGIYLDLLDMGLGKSGEDVSIYEKVVRLLCKDGRVQKARNIIKKAVGFGIEPSGLVLNAMVSGYCKKKDYEDIPSLFTELRCSPDTVLGNKIVHSLSRDFGVERADSLMRRLEQLGFIPDEITFGILIGWRCREGKVKDAFIYFSEILARSLRPHAYTYNAIMSGLFNEGMWKHAGDILNEMKDGEVLCDSSTFGVLLAGYFKARQFDRVKTTVVEMVDRGLIQLSLSEDPICKALIILGLKPSFVKVKRDNDKGFCKTEFFDSLGNGLYLDTDVDEYEKTMAKVLNDAMVPDFNSLILEICRGGENKSSVMMIDEMACWGQELSSSCFSTLVKGLCASPRSIKPVSSLLEKMSEFSYDLDEEAVNKLVQTYCRKGFTSRARIFFEGMLMRHLKIENETFTALFKGLCKKGDLIGLRDCWQLAWKYNWTPEWEDGRVILGYLCQLKLLDEAQELFEATLAVYPHNLSDYFHAFLENLCVGGLTCSAHILVDELLKQGFFLGHMVYNNLVSGFCKEKKFTEAFLIVDTMLAKNLALSVDVIAQLIPWLCRAGKFETAIVLKDACSREPSSLLLTVYRALLSGFCKCMMVEAAVNILQEMLLKGLILDVEEYNMIFEGYCQSNNLTEVLALLGIMMRKNLTLSISSYRNLVHLMCVNGKYAVACRLKDLMLLESNLPVLIRYNILIYYLFSTKGAFLVHKLINEFQMKGVQFDEVTYNFVIHGFSRCKDFSHSVDYLASMISKGYRPSNRSLRGVIRCLCSSGELGEALKLSREMESRGWLHGVLIQNIMVDTYLRHGKLPEAVNFLDRIVAQGLIPDNVNYDYLIKRLCQHGILEKAVDLLSIMLKKGKVPCSTSFDCIISGLSTGNKLEIALDLHSEMLFRKLKPSINTWTILVQRLSANGRSAEAEKLLDLMVQMGETPSREMYCSLINRYRSENNLGKASKLVQEMQQNGYKPDFETHWSLISNLGDSSRKDDGNGGRRFLSGLLSQIGFSWKNP